MPGEIHSCLGIEDRVRRSNGSLGVGQSKLRPGGKKSGELTKCNIAQVKTQ